MNDVYAVRNIKLCTKDCLCLYVCPTGASDTEDSIIDKSKCIGCGVCASACPSGAISMVPKTMPPQQPHHTEVVAAMNLLLRSKAEQENISAGLPNVLMKAIAKSNRIMAEDIIREAGYMLPQSDNTRDFLLEIRGMDGIPEEAIQKLLSSENLSYAEVPQAAETWTCGICGYIHEGPLPADFQCPLCRQPASVFVKS